MVEVFKTDVKDSFQAEWLLEQIHKTSRSYEASFDLEDCDKILRVKSSAGCVESFLLINLLKRLGFQAEILPD